ncbi:MAG: SDR family oxidoreductase [Thermonemataceae bacterium]
MGKVILVTGANRGIGKEIARQLATQGHTVYVGARKEEEAAKTAKEIGHQALAATLDVTNIDNITQLTSKIASEQGKLDVLINNAGIFSNSTGLTDTPLEEIKKVMDTNYFGVIQLTKAFLPLLKKSDEGRVINMSSGMGAWRDLQGNYAAYRLSKVGLNSITVLLANELQQEGIKVNSMSPGWVRTDMGGANATRSVEQGADTAVWLATTATVPTGKFFYDRKEIDF